MAKLHSREKAVMSAESKLRSALVDLEKEFDLTRFELIQVIQSVAGEYILSICKYAIRRERHGSTDKPGGLE